MERLSFDGGSRYDGLEASIHITRYLLAKNYCDGRRVLDIACGEGYGSRLLKDWGAAEVYGVDISEEALSHARLNFAGDGIHFIRSSGEDLLSVLAEERFDLIVSLETIEHLHSPETFLGNLRLLLKPGGTIIISCPNDWWYFPTEKERNPYHLRKYHFDEFRQMVESALGPASSWMLGAPTFGFLNTVRTAAPEANPAHGQMAMMQTKNLSLVQLVPSEPGAGPRDENASYFVGIWGKQAFPAMETAALLPLSMDAFKKGVFQGHLADHESMKSRLWEADSRIAQLEEQLKQTDLKSREFESEQRKQGLLRRAVLAENRLLHDTLHQLRMQLNDAQATQMQQGADLRMQLNDVQAKQIQQCADLRMQLTDAQAELATQIRQHAALEEAQHELRIGYSRYVRLRSMVPAGLVQVVRVARNLIRGNGK